MKKMMPVRILCLIIAIIGYFFMTSSPVSAAFSSADSEKLSPSSPPRMPIADYGDGGHNIIDLMYLRYDFDIFLLNGGSIGYNYVNNKDVLGFNIAAGFIYLNGSDDEGYVDVYNWNVPINANIGFRLFGGPDQTSLVLVGGIHYMYSWVIIDLPKNDISAYMYGPAYGPLLGAKLQIVVSPMVKIIPYYVFTHAVYDYSLEVDGKPYDIEVDPVTSHLLGFDIEFGAVSVGALLDMLNNTDSDKITIRISYDFNWSEGGGQSGDTPQEVSAQ